MTTTSSSHFSQRCLKAITKLTFQLRSTSTTGILTASKVYQQMASWTWPNWVFLLYPFVFAQGETWNVFHFQGPWPSRIGSTWRRQWERWQINSSLCHSMEVDMSRSHQAIQTSSMKQNTRNSSMHTSCLKAWQLTNSSLKLAFPVTGHMVVVATFQRTRASSSGLVRKTTWG